jgi:hypothetical protein
VIFGDINARLGHAPDEVTLLAVGVLFLAGLLITLWFGRVPGQRINVGVLTYLWLVVVGLGLYASFGPFFLATDGPRYDAQAVDIARQLAGGRSGIDINQGKVGWPTMLGTVYAVLGRVPLAGILISCTVVALTAAVTGKAAVAAWGRCPTLPLVAIFCLSPSFLLLGPSLMREPLCWFGTALATLAAIRRIRAARGWIAPLLLGALVLFWVRTLLGVLVVGGLLLGYVLVALKRRYGWTVSAIASGAVSAAMLLLVGPVLALAGQDLLSVAEGRGYLAESATTGFGSVPSTSGGVTGLLQAGVQSLPRVLLGPFPWEVGLAAVWLWIIANSLVWWATIVLIWRAGRRAAWDDVVLTAVVAGLVVLMGMAVVLTNYGIVVRLRSDVVVLLVPVVLGLWTSGTEDTGKGGRRAPARASRPVPAALPDPTTPRPGRPTRAGAGRPGAGRWAAHPREMVRHDGR